MKLTYRLPLTLACASVLASCQDQKHLHTQLEELKAKNSQLETMIHATEQTTPATLPASEIQSNISRLESERANILLENSKILNDIRIAKGKHDVLVETLEALRNSLNSQPEK